MARPRRSCVGCRTTDDKDRLVRLVKLVRLGGGPSVVLDLPQRAPGRGAYLHPDPACFSQAIRRRALPRALRLTRFDPDELRSRWEAVVVTSGDVA